MPAIYYFGTPLDQTGHGFYECSGEYLRSAGIHYADFAKKAFDPERMIDEGKARLGDNYFFRINGYTICYIEGSCRDKRPGSKSVFFTEAHVLYGEFVLQILSIPIVRKIIKQMPFEVKWKLNEEYMEKVKNLGTSHKNLL